MSYEKNLRDELEIDPESIFHIIFLAWAVFRIHSERNNMHVDFESIHL